jgi:hypothetical protein
MTIKEIAKLCGVSESLVKEWISTIKKNGQDMTDHGQIMTVIEMKCLEAQKTKKPADFTLEETLAIIRAGGNETLANLLADNAGGGAGGYIASHLREVKPLTGAYLRELTTAYDKSIISRDDWRRLAGLDPVSNPAAETAAPAVLPPPCHDLPDFMRERKEKAVLLSGPVAWYPPIPVIQAFIDERCIREGSMTHIDADKVFFTWQRDRGLETILDTRQLFKYLGLMGYATKKKNSLFSVEGLRLKPEAVRETPEAAG